MLSQKEKQYADEVFVVTCEFHKKNPLANSTRCLCRVYTGREAKGILSGEVWLFDPETIEKLKIKFPYHLYRTNKLSGVQA